MLVNVLVNPEHTTAHQLQYFPKPLYDFSVLGSLIPLTFVFETAHSVVTENKKTALTGANGTSLQILFKSCITLSTIDGQQIRN